MLYSNQSRGGYFYKVSGDDAIIIHHLLGYKIKERATVWFSKDAMDKVTSTLKMYSISFEIIGESRYTFLNNNYLTFLSKATLALDKEYRINEIVKKIERLDSKRLDSLIKLIEEFLYE